MILNVLDFQQIITIHSPGNVLLYIFMIGIQVVHPFKFSEKSWIMDLGKVILNEPPLEAFYLR